MVSLYPKAEAGNVMMVWVEKLLAAYSGSPTPKPEAKLNNLATSAVASTLWSPQSPVSGWEKQLAGNRYVSKLGKLNPGGVHEDQNISPSGSSSYQLLTIYF